MKILFLFLSTLLILGCTETPAASTSKETVAQNKIKQNKTEAQKAQKAYLRLQKLRNNE